jgi:hypothetical protein
LWGLGFYFVWLLLWLRVGWCVLWVLFFELSVVAGVCCGGSVGKSGFGCFMA